MTAPAGTGRRLAVLSLLAVVVAMTGCGVPTQSEATPVVVETVGRPQPTPPPSSGATGASLWFVDDGGLVEVPAPSGGSTAAELLAELAAGPPSGSPESVRSLLGDPAHGGTLLSLPEETAASTPSGVMTVAVSDAFSSLPTDEQVLLLGQIVMTFGGAGAQAVLVTDSQGAPLAIPLPDGRLLDRPATPADFHALVTR